MASRKKIRQSASVYVFQVFNYCFLTALVMMCLYPMWYCLMASFSEPSKMMAHMGPLLTPLGFSVEAYKKVFLNPNIISGYKNTLIILVVGVSLNLVMTSLAAYVLSRKNVMWKKPLMIFIMITMFFSGGLIPTYLNLKSLHLNNTLWGLIIPWLINTFNMIIMRTAFESIPESLIEAAQIDGAGPIRCYFHIALSVSKAIIGAAVALSFADCWNMVEQPLVFLPMREDLHPLSVAFNQLSQESTGIEFAGATLYILPALMIYLFFQKDIMTGIQLSEMK